MNELAAQFVPQSTDPALAGVIKLAIMAVGGQGGGVLTKWIEDVARASGYAVQATSVAGVSQRTGATIYYVEMAAQPGVFSLAPAGGDVDILIAAEMMEAGRAIQRGFVTPDRTTLIASTHRALAVSEKSVPGDGTASSDEVMAAAEIAARRFISADMETLAVVNGSVISASLLGALAASEALPFPRTAFEDAITRSGKGVDASLRAFAAGFDAALGAVAEPAVELARRDGVSGPQSARAAWDALVLDAAALPEPVADMAQAGLRKVVEFQDTAYGAEYLARVQHVLTQDTAAQGHILTREAAKYIANAMAYDDVIRVADLKTRRSRFARIHREMGTDADQLMHVTEFMHPRAEEIVGLLPARLARRIAASDRAMGIVDTLFNRGRRLRTDGFIGFTMLHLVGSLRGWRRRTLRHADECAHLETWLDRALSHAAQDYALAVELIRCRRLIKGYSDTHSRGLGKFDRVVGAVDMLAGREDAAQWIARLREAALKDEKGDALDGALKTVRSFTHPSA